MPLPALLSDLTSLSGGSGRQKRIPPRAPSRCSSASSLSFATVASTDHTSTSSAPNFRETRETAFLKIAAFYAENFPEKLSMVEPILDRYPCDVARVVATFAQKYPNWDWVSLPAPPSRRALPPLKKTTAYLKARPVLGVRWKVAGDGVWAKEVHQGGIAQKSGLLKGMKLVSIDGHPVNDASSLERAMRYLYQRRTAKLLVEKPPSPPGTVVKALLIGAPACIADMLSRDPHRPDTIVLPSTASAQEVLSSLCWLLSRNHAGDGLFCYLGIDACSPDLCELEVLKILHSISKKVFLTLLVNQDNFLNFLPYKLGAAGDGGVDWKQLPGHNSAATKAETEGLAVVIAGSDPQLPEAFVGIIEETDTDATTIYGLIYGLIGNLKQPPTLSATRRFDPAWSYVLGCPPEEEAYFP